MSAIFGRILGHTLFFFIHHTELLIFFAAALLAFVFFGCVYLTGEEVLTGICFTMNAILRKMGTAGFVIAGRNAARRITAVRNTPDLSGGAGTFAGRANAVAGFAVFACIIAAFRIGSTARAFGTTMFLIR